MVSPLAAFVMSGQKLGSWLQTAGMLAANHKNVPAPLSARATFPPTANKARANAKVRSEVQKPNLLRLIASSTRPRVFAAFGTERSLRSVSVFRGMGALVLMI